MDADIIVVGAGLAGLVAAAEAADAGKRVLLLDQEGEQNLGGQAFWSFGGLFFVDSPEQRRLGIRDSRELAGRDWEATAGFDRVEDHWPRQWAQAYLDFAAGEKRAWLHGLGVRWFPMVGWAERGGQGAAGPGNSVPRFHITWGTGPGLIEPFEARVLAHAGAGRITLHYRHRVLGLTFTGGTVTGVHGEVLEPSKLDRGESSSRAAIGEFSVEAGAVIVTSGGIGGNHKLVRQNWPTARLGPAPEFMVAGVPKHVDGELQQAVHTQGARLINADRMWHYTEGVRNWHPIWPGHGIRILPGPSSLWLDPTGRRLPAPNYPGFDTLSTLTHIGTHRYPHTWFLLNRAIIKKEFTLSGSEQNPDLTLRNLRAVAGRVGKRVAPPVQAFMDRGADFFVASTLDDLLRRMDAGAGDHALDPEIVRREVRDRDLQITHPFSKDPQVAAIRGARAYLSERLVRIARPAPLLHPGDGPLIAVKLNILTRKTLGGLETDLQSRVLGEGGQPIPGLYAAGEVAGFGGGGVHGYRALEGTFLGGCLYSGRVAGRAAAGAT
ncbi:FAD-binding dehydrogenase [Deinococcus sp. KSM4-11]|uniref:FAD-binding dehydrogenase n=1 Tax=Deinococcus sp. KSM4-11 TaxID=2568654 RepID=UPI001454E1D7|nr:FAD-binding dehydrogenase [Deinococcus sp. KSM4-11]